MTQIMLCGGSHIFSCIDTSQIDTDGERLVCELVIKDLDVYLDRHNYERARYRLITWYANCVGHSTTFLAGSTFRQSRQATRLLVDSFVLSKLNYCLVV